MQKLMKLLALGAACLCAPALAQAQQKPAKKPNILAIWGDDIGQFNVSAYAGRRLRRPVAPELPGVPAADEAGLLQPGPRHGVDHQQPLEAVSRRARRP
jgi:hypothetical protein